MNNFGPDLQGIPQGHSLPGPGVNDGDNPISILSASPDCIKSLRIIRDRVLNDREVCLDSAAIGDGSLKGMR